MSLESFELIFVSLLGGKPSNFKDSKLKANCRTHSQTVTTTACRFSAAEARRRGWPCPALLRFAVRRQAANRGNNNPDAAQYARSGKYVRGA